ncbi:FUSC family protein [Herbiconiux sp. CPCC 205716]|uniref:FUSC family protein n=1 Tax=Herbiconiux gentiana TaxID=2970912 RepID=A0ABT2GMI7_9MICO|nr:FUSC family protein [Herbiconiux gentiana]MCS5716490.1 FUSC family protein [Herbiconiux gentiana]
MTSDQPRPGRWAAVARASLAPARAFQTPARTPLLQVLKTAVAAVVAWALCSFVSSGQPPLFGAIAAIIVVQPSVNQSLSRAVERSIGVIAGVVVAYLVSLVFGAPSWLILLAIVLSLLVGWALRFPQSSTVQIPISAMLVLSIGAQTPGYAFERIIETVIGALIGVVVNWLVVPPVALKPAREAVTGLGREIAATMDSLATVLSAPTDAPFRTGMLVEARLLRPMQAKAQKAIDAAEESLRFNPRRTANRQLLGENVELLTMLGIVTNRVLGMARAVTDHFDSTLPEEPNAAAIAEELRRAAHDLRLVLDEAGPEADPGEPPVDLEPALTAPLRAIVPDPQHWILIGSLLEDLRRVREEIVGASADLR